MKKILIVNIGTEIGGIEKCLINFLKYLEKIDCEVDLALWKPNGPLYNEIPNFVNILPSPGPGSFSSIKKEQDTFKLVVKVFKYVKFKLFNKFDCAWKSLPKNKKNYDIAISYCQNGYSPYYIIDNVKAKEKYLWYHELNYIGSNKTQDIDKYYFKKFNKIICVSKACQNNMSNSFPDIKEKFITLYNFYNLDEIINKASIEPNPFFNINKKVVLTVGRLSSEKGFQLAINACKQLSNICNDFVWYWVGDGQCFVEAQKLIVDLNIQDYMVLLGNRENPYPYMVNCDVYVQPSLSEAYCTTIIEAKVLNKPIVSTNVDSVYEQIVQTSYSKIVEKEPEKISEAIYTILNTISSIDAKYDMNEINCSESYDKLFYRKQK